MANIKGKIEILNAIAQWEWTQNQYALMGWWLLLSNLRLRLQESPASQEQNNQQQQPATRDVAVNNRDVAVPDVSNRDAADGRPGSQSSTPMNDRKNRVNLPVEGRLSQVQYETNEAEVPIRWYRYSLGHYVSKL